MQLTVTSPQFTGMDCAALDKIKQLRNYGFIASTITGRVVAAVHDGQADPRFLAIEEQRADLEAALTDSLQGFFESNQAELHAVCTVATSHGTVRCSLDIQENFVTRDADLNLDLSLTVTID